MSQIRIDRNKLSDAVFQAIIDKQMSKKLPAGISQPQLTGLYGQHPPARGTAELIELFNHSPWLRAIVHKIGCSVAEVQWTLWIKKGKNNDTVRDRSLQYASKNIRKQYLNKQVPFDVSKLKPVEDHPLLDLLYTGNSDMIGFNVMQCTQFYMDLVGESFWILERNGMGVPIAIWPLPPHWVQRFPTVDRPFYQISGTTTGLYVEVPAKEIIYFRDPNPTNPYGRGSGTARSLGDELEIDEYAARHNKAFFYNRARPDLIISGDNISQDDSRRLEQKWLEKYQGWWKAYKPLFFSRKIDIKELTQTFENLQMVQLRKFERDTFISVFSAPPEKFGLVQDSKRSTIAAADYFWNKDIIQPRIEMLRQHMQVKLVPLFDDRLILDYDTPVIEDDEFKRETMRYAPWAFRLNEWRQLADHPSMGEDGEKILVPLNSMLMTTDGKIAQEDARPSQSTPKPADQDATQDTEPAPQGGKKAVLVPDQGLADKLRQKLISAVNQRLGKT